MTNMTLGQRIAARRKLSGFSQEILAEKLNVTRQSVSKWESDVSIPDIDKLIVLSKLFECSIGWLLGMEIATAQQPGFSDDQLNTIEKLIARYHPPRKHRPWKILASATFFIAIIALSAYLGNQIILLNAKNDEAVNHIYALSIDNKNLKNQLDEINELLTEQLNQQQLLTDFFRVQANTDEESKNISSVLYMRPKVYQEDNEAFLSIENPTTGYYTKIACKWDHANQLYIANFTVPAQDGYKISFLIVNDYGYQEENLLLRDPSFAMLGTYCTFHLDPAGPQYQQMKQEKATVVSQDKMAGYSFNLPIYTPHIFAKTAVAYKEISIKMVKNDVVIWEKSYLDLFTEAAGGVFLNAANIPIMPDVQIPLTGIVSGDVLQLILTAETANGGQRAQKYQTLLDYIVIE